MKQPTDIEEAPTHSIYADKARKCLVIELNGATVVISKKDAMRLLEELSTDDGHCGHTIDELQSEIDALRIKLDAAEPNDRAEINTRIASLSTLIQFKRNP